MNYHASSPAKHVPIFDDIHGICDIFFVIFICYKG